MPKLIAPILSSRMFNYDKKARLFSVEASALPREWYGPIWDDSYEEGFAIQSARTGRIVPFIKEWKNDDQMVLRSHFMQGVIDGGRITAVVYND